MIMMMMISFDACRLRLWRLVGGGGGYSNEIDVLLWNIRISTMAVLGRAALMASFRERGVVVVGMGVPSLVIRRVLPCLRGVTEVLVVGLKGLKAFLPATLVQEYRGGAGAGGGGRSGRGSPGRCAGRAGGAGGGPSSWDGGVLLPS